MAILHCLHGNTISHSLFQFFTEVCTPQHNSPSTKQGILTQVQTPTCTVYVIKCLQKQNNIQNAQSYITVYYTHVDTITWLTHTFILRLTHESLPTQVRIHTQNRMCASTSQMAHCTLNMMLQCCSQFTREAHSVHFELDSEWMVGQAVGKLRRLLYHSGNH